MIQFERCTEGLSSIPCPCTACTPAPTQDDEPMLFYQSAVFYDEDLSIDATEDAYYAPEAAVDKEYEAYCEEAYAAASEAAYYAREARAGNAYDAPADFDSLTAEWDAEVEDARQHRIDATADNAALAAIGHALALARAAFRADGWAYLP